MRFLLVCPCLVCACLGAPGAEDTPKPKPAGPTLKEDRERLTGTWRLPLHRGKNSLGYLVIHARTITFTAKGAGTIRVEISIVRAPYVGPFTFTLEERPKGRVIVAEGKAFDKKTAIGYKLNGDKLQLDGGKASLSNGGRVGVPGDLKGTWYRLIVNTPAAKKELKRFTGTWDKAGATTGDGEIPAAKLKGFQVTFEDDELTESSAPEKGLRVAIDPTRKPAAIDLMTAAGDVKRGIYEFKDKDTLRLRVAPFEEDRPTAFTPVKKGHILLILKRAKK